jgi:hypothetical protein
VTGRALYLVFLDDNCLRSPPTWARLRLPSLSGIASLHVVARRLDRLLPLSPDDDRIPISVGTPPKPKWKTSGRQLF